MNELDTRLVGILEDFRRNDLYSVPEALAAIKADVATYVVQDDEYTLEDEPNRQGGIDEASSRLAEARNDLRATQRKLLEGDNG